MLIYICDDSAMDLHMTRRSLERYAAERNLTFTIKPFTSGASLLEDYKNTKLQPALLFLDIYMVDISGIETARELRAAGFTADIIFTTSSTEYAMESYDVNALYYLNKPYRYEDFVKAISRFKDITKAASPQLTFSVKGVPKSVYHDDIVYLETGRHTVILHTLQDTQTFSGSLAQIAQLFQGEENFIRCGQSFLINLNYVDSCDDSVLVMQDGSTIPIPFRKKNEILNLVSGWSKTRSASSTN